MTDITEKEIILGDLLLHVRCVPNMKKPRRVKDGIVILYEWQMRLEGTSVPCVLIDWTSFDLHSEENPLQGARRVALFELSLIQQRFLKGLEIPALSDLHEKFLETFAFIDSCLSILLEGVILAPSWDLLGILPPNHAA